MSGASSGRPFIVYALARSQTAWMARYLSYGGWHVGHEQAVTMRVVGDIGRFFARHRVGSVESAAAPGWRLLLDICPELRQAVVRRPVDDCVDSVRRLDLARAGIVYDFDKLRRNFVYIDRCLQQIAARPGVLALDYAELATEQGCRRLFEHCLGLPFDEAWWRLRKDENVQMDVLDHLRYYQRHRAAIDAFKRDCWRHLRRRVARQAA